MPGIENWLTSPLNTIQTLFNQYGHQNTECVKDYFQKRCEDPVVLSQVPSLNCVPLHDLKPNSVVRFRCMVQDMYDPEYYLSVYSVRDQKLRTTCLKSGKYRDVVEHEPGEEIDHDSNQNVTASRQTLYCVPLPGETAWVKNIYKSQCGENSSSLPLSFIHSDGLKRARDEGTDNTMTHVTTENVLQHTEKKVERNERSMEVDNECKKSKQENKSGCASLTPDLNFPLPGETGPACLVKIYDEVDVYKLNDAVEFIGILSVDPSLANLQNEESQDSDILGEPEFETPEEKSVHSPPPSLVPRIHVLTAQKLVHNNPNITQTVNQDMSTLKPEINLIRSKLLSILEHLVLGDSLAAEYLLCHLLSCVYNRMDVMPVGKFCLNISGCPRLTNYSELFMNILSKFLTKVYFLSMTLENMNKLSFSPQKDYKANRLKSGVLQLSDHTNFIVDETALQPGNLDTTGVKNVTALGNLIRWQKVDYDFVYHNLEFKTNVQVLVLSEGKSLLPSDFHVPMKSTQLPEDLTTYFTSLESHVNEELKIKLRDYISILKFAEYIMPDDLQKNIQDDFVQIRREDPKNMSIDDFHSLLCLVRLLSISYGSNCPSEELWDKAKAMEHQRKQRIIEFASN